MFNITIRSRNFKVFCIFLLLFFFISKLSVSLVISHLFSIKTDIIDQTISLISLKLKSTQSNDFN